MARWSRTWRAALAAGAVAAFAGQAWAQGPGSSGVAAPPVGRVRPTEPPLPAPAGADASRPGGAGAERLPGEGTGRTAEKLSARVSLYVLDRSLDDTLTEVARLGGLRIRFNDRLDDTRIVARRLQGSAREVLDEIAREHNLAWFAEHDLVEIAKADTATVRTFALGRVTDAQVRNAMQRYALVNADFALEVDERNAVARVFAPPRLMQRLESILTSLKPPVPTDELVDVIRFGVVERNLLRGELPKPEAAKPETPRPDEAKAPPAAPIFPFPLPAPGPAR